MDIGPFKKKAKFKNIVKEMNNRRKAYSYFQAKKKE